MHNDYFSHPAYQDYPVVGVSWTQAVAFCNWRTNFKNSYQRDKGEPNVSRFRLPNEAEWEYAALGLSELRNYNAIRGRKKYPWSGQYTRSGKRQTKGEQLANFKQGKGDYGGIAGWSDDGADITAEVKSYQPNDYG